MKNQESKEIELDVVSLFKTLWRRKFSILITALLFAIGALGYSAFVAKKTLPKYQSYLCGQPSEPRKQCLDQPRSSSGILLG